MSVIVLANADGPAVRRPARPRPAAHRRRRAAARGLRPAHRDRADRRAASSTTSRPASTSSSPSPASSWCSPPTPRSTASRCSARSSPRTASLPRALGSRGDRLAYSNGIVFLAVMAIVLILAFDAEVTRLIQLYIVGVFVSFNLSQLGMIRHWTRHLKTETRPGRPPPDAALAGRSTPSASAFTAVVLVIVLVTKFLAGAWIAILAMGVFFLIMQGIRRHYDNVARRARRRRGRQGAADPGARDRAGLQAAQADAAGAGVRQGVAGPTCSRASTSPPTPPPPTGCSSEWDERNIGVPLKVLHSPYREIVRPIVDYAAGDPRRPTRAAWSRSTSRSTSSAAGGSSCCTTRPRCGSRAGCCSRPGVMVTSVPYQLRSSQIAARARASASDARVRSGDLRRGNVRDDAAPAGQVQR